MKTKLRSWLIENTEPRFTVRALAKRLGVSTALVHHWKSGFRKPSPKQAKKLVKVTAIKLEDLI